MVRTVQNIKTFHKGQNIYREGQKGSHAFMIKKGSVNLYRMADNKKVIIERLGKGGIFGEMGPLGGLPRSKGAEAAEYCELMVLSEQQIKNMLDRCPKTVQRITDLLVRRLTQANRPKEGAGKHGTFLSICRILEMSYRSHVNVPASRNKQKVNTKLGLNILDLSRDIKSILQVSQLEIDRTLQQLRALKIVEITPASKNAKAAFQERYVKVNDMESFFEVASNLYRELSRGDLLTIDCDYVDIDDFAMEVDTTGEILYKKMANSEIPENLFFFHRPNALAWAGEKSPEFFKTVKKKKKKIKDLEVADDIVFVDNATLKEIFAKLGYYKLAVLLTMVGPDARKKMLGCLANKIAAVVEQEAANREFDNEAEFEDVQEELIELIKVTKGVTV